MEGDSTSTYDAMGSKEKQGRETLIACTMDILKDEKDEGVLESIFQLVGDLRTNSGLRKGLKNFRKNGWAVIQKMKKQNYDFKIQDNTLTSLDSEKAKPKLGSGLNFENQAMNNDLILKNIFECLSLSDLKNCRLVSKRWRDLTLSSWRGKAVLRTERLFGELIFGDNTHAAMQQFNKNALKSLETAYQRYDMNFRGNQVSPDAQIEYKIMKLKLFSSSIRHLYVDCDDWEIMSLLLTKLPELRSLQLQLKCFQLYSELVFASVEGREYPFPDLVSATSNLSKLELTISNAPLNLVVDITMPWKKIFQNLPALKSLRLESCGRRVHWMCKYVIESICEVRREQNFSILNLEELIIIDPLNLSPVPDRIATGVIESKLPLQTLCINLGNQNQDNNNPSAFSDLLNAHAKTLHYFECGIGSLEQVPSLPLTPYFPSKVELSKLKELVLRSDCVTAFHLLSSLDTPNLENLTMEPDTCNNLQPNGQEKVIKGLLESDSFMDSCSLPNLKKFFLDHAYINLGLTDLKLLAKSMPNVTDLMIPLAEETFPIVYKLWPGLESLHLLATGLTYSLLEDEAITGFPAGEFGCESRESNITNLKKLRKFALETNICGFKDLPRPRRPCITDLSAVNGFLQLPKLRILELETLYKFSPNVMGALKDRLSDIKIKEPNIFRVPL